MLLNVVYLPKVGKFEPRCARASGFVEKTKLSESSNQKALAVLLAEKYMSYTGESYTSLWDYKGTVSVDNRSYHYFLKKVINGKDEHVWFDVNLDRQDADARRQEAILV